MGNPATALPLPAIEIPGYGKLSLAPQPNPPLLMVFGGIDVPEGQLDPTDKSHAKDMVHSGVYMWNYFNRLKSRFHIFVALTPKVNGAMAYRHVLSALQSKSSAPGGHPSGQPQPFGGPYQVLYLFSGGYKPGSELLASYSVKLFSSIFLVDIWMGSEGVGSYYQHLVTANAGKTYYIHTSFGANNSKVRDAISKKLGGTRAILVKGTGNETGMQTHLRTNEEAVARIPLN